MKRLKRSDCSGKTVDEDTQAKRTHSLNTGECNPSEWRYAQLTAAGREKEKEQRFSDCACTPSFLRRTLGMLAVSISLAKKPTTLEITSENNWHWRDQQTTAQNPHSKTQAGPANCTGAQIYDKNHPKCPELTLVPAIGSNPTYSNVSGKNNLWAGCENDLSPHPVSLTSDHISHSSLLSWYFHIQLGEIRVYLQPSQSCNSC